MCNNFEIERKFLIRYPNLAYLDSLNGCEKVLISQLYTIDKVRLRRWEQNGKTLYIKTVKKTITDITRIEEENEISQSEYEELKKLADPNRKVINKIRYRLPYENKLLEIDLFDFWNDRAFLEVELESESEKFSIPPFIEVIKEVTCDKRYRNSALAVEVPIDNI